MLQNYEPHRFENYKIYGNSIDVEINPENLIFSNHDIDSIPDIVNISYCDVTDIIDLFNTPYGGKLIEKVYSNDVVLNIFPVDTTYIDLYEKEYLIGHESLLKRHNVNFYQIWYDPFIQFPYHLGSTIHEALLPFIERYRKFSFDYTKKEKHFITLNNVHTPSREILYNFYNLLSESDKQKFICTFNFMNIGLEHEKENFSTIFKDFNLVFGESIFPYYDSSLIEIVCESSSVSVTEKSFKPLLSGTPFIWWLYGNNNNFDNQIKIFESIGIDTCYFGIDYKNLNTIQEKVDELLQLPISEILVKYKGDFEKALENKQKVFDWIDKLTNDIVKK